MTTIFFSFSLTHQATLLNSHKLILQETRLFLVWQDDKSRDLYRSHTAKQHFYVQNTKTKDSTVRTNTNNTYLNYVLNIQIQIRQLKMH